jgi:hypothetical protein
MRLDRGKARFSALPRSDRHRTLSHHIVVLNDYAGEDSSCFLRTSAYKHSIIGLSPSLTSTTLSRGRALVLSLVVLRWYGCLQAAGQGDGIPALAFEARSCREPHFLRFAEDQPLSALLAYQYHAPCRTPHCTLLLIPPSALASLPQGPRIHIDRAHTMSPRLR